MSLVPIPRFLDILDASDPTDRAKLLSIYIKLYASRNTWEPSVERRTSQSPVFVLGAFAVISCVTLVAVVAILLSQS